MKLYEEALSCAQEAEEELWKIFFCWGKNGSREGVSPRIAGSGRGIAFFFSKFTWKNPKISSCEFRDVFFFFLLWSGANDLPGIRWSEWQGGSEFSIFFELRMVRSFEWILFIHFFLSKRLIHRIFNFNHHLSTVFFQKTKNLEVKQMPWRVCHTFIRPATEIDRWVGSPFTSQPTSLRRRGKKRSAQVATSSTSFRFT